MQRIHPRRGLSVLIALTAVAAAAALVADLPSAIAQREPAPLQIDATTLTAGATAGVLLTPRGIALAADAPLAEPANAYRRFGVAESAVVPLAGPSEITSLDYDGDVPEGAGLDLEVRGLVEGRWSEWREPGTLGDLAGVTAVQSRLTLRDETGATSPYVRGLTVLAVPVRLLRAAQTTSTGPPTVRLWATRVGLVGRATANGHVVTERDRFVALPSKRALNTLGSDDYRVQIIYGGRTATAPVWDVGPWNMQDDYWNASREAFGDLARWTSQAEAAFFSGHNSGRDGFGRFVVLPTSIDIADGTFWDDLGMTENDWVHVTFLWLDGPSPAARPSPSVAPKTPPPLTPLAPTDNRRAASYNAPAPASRVFLPLVAQDAGGWTTSLTIQNPTTGPVTGTVELYDDNVGRVGTQRFELAAGASRTLTPSSADGVPTGFQGAGVVTASGSVAVVVNADRPGFDRLAYEGLTAGAPKVSVPLVFKDYNGWSTGIQAQNLGPSGTTVQVTYTGPTGAAGSEWVLLGPMAAHTFYLPANSALPAGFVGSAVVQSANAQPLAVVANAVRADGAAMAYAGLTNGAPRLHAPLLFKRYNGWDSGLQLVNLLTTATSAVVSFQGGTTSYSENSTVPAAGSATLYQPSQPQLPNGFTGTAVVATGGNGRLAGLVNAVKTGSTAATAYTLGQPLAAQLAVPLVQKDDDGWDTGIQVMNPGPTATSVNVLFYDEAGTPVHHIEEPLAPGATRTFYTPSLAELPNGFRGAALIQAGPGGAISAVVNATTR